MAPPPITNTNLVGEIPPTFLPTNTDDNDNENNNGGIQIIDEESSLSTATSLTSIITSHTPHTLRTGVDTADVSSPFREDAAATDTTQNHRNTNTINASSNVHAAFTPRARSMSVPNAVILHPTSASAVRTSSATRSNPLTRTPMRHASPLLVTGRYLFATAVSVGNEDGVEEEDRDVRRDVGGDGVGVNGGIPEEVEEGRGNEPNPAIRRAGHFLHRHRLTTAHSSTPNQITRPKQMSTKQLPSHRKIRRWNNDRFIGTHSENHGVIHPVVVREGEEWYQEYWMPNYPREYRSEFARLVNDETQRGQHARERFIKGEVVASHFETKHGTHPIPKQFQGISQSNVGNQLYRRLSPRIRSILSRCYDNSAPPLDAASTTNRHRTSLAIQAISAFEAYLISCTFQSKKSVVPSCGFPPLLSVDTYQVLEKVLCAPPDLVIKKNKNKTTQGVSTIPSIHFYFADGPGRAQDDTTNNNNCRNNGAFYRILLYAVCNFHGLVASSYALDGNKKKPRGFRGNRGDSVKIVTVQSGV
eukprot:CCRYP_001043-RB/>CCRYP_001043-RB protein AED:0.13 eAED:0.13 QI:218/1/1/1/1/0.66/3/0/529